MIKYIRENISSYGPIEWSLVVAMTAIVVILI